MQIALEVSLLAVAHRDLDAEIDADADEENGEGDRDEVQRADHGKPERGRNRQADEQAQHHRKHEPARAKREPEDEQNRDDRQDDIEQGPVSDRAELVVGHGNRPGKADADALVLA